MTQTLCANLRCNYSSLEKLNMTFTFASIVDWVGHTSNVTTQPPFESYSSEINNEYLSIASQVRDQLSKVVNGLTTLEVDETTIAEEWPIALEFNGWASDDCVEFCNSHGLIDDLRKCRRALNDIFSNINKSIAELDYYQEIGVDDEGHVVIRLEIESDRKTYKKEYRSWVSWMVDNLSDENRMFMSVSIDRL